MIRSNDESKMEVKSMNSIKSLLKEKDYILLHQLEYGEIYSKNGGLGSTLIFTVMKVCEEAYLEKIESAIQWIIENVLRQDSLAQIGFNAILISEYPIAETQLQGLTDKHAIRDTDKISLSFGQIWSNTKDVIFQTAISYGYKTKELHSAKTWILLGHVRSTFFAICDALKRISI